MNGASGGHSPLNVDLCGSPHSSGSAPLFRPTREQFADFGSYLRRIAPLAAPYGMARVCPPPGYVAASCAAAHVEHVATIERLSVEPSPTISHAFRVRRVAHESRVLSLAAFARLASANAPAGELSLCAARRDTAH